MGFVGEEEREGLCLGLNVGYTISHVVFTCYFLKHFELLEESHLKFKKPVLLG